MEKLFTVIIVVLIYGNVLCQKTTSVSFLPEELRHVVLMQPTGEIIDDLPEMRIVEDSTELYKEVMHNIDNSFVDEFIDMYFIAQVYLNNNGDWDSIEPAYLALTTNQGGFAKFGFSLLFDNKHINKPRVPYIDITVGQATASLGKLMSFSQLYPHEMGHVLFHLLSPEDTISNNTKNVDMHFFSIITDYSTAFNEGFAEHIENISRTFEKNEDIKAGIIAEIETIEEDSRKSINGFERDFIYPYSV